MRRRLVVVFLVPLVGVLLVLGGAYAWSAARSILPVRQIAPFP